jgi:hypothetical protein
MKKSALIIALLTPLISAGCCSKIARNPTSEDVPGMSPSFTPAANRPHWCGTKVHLPPELHHWSDEQQNTEVRP